MMGLKIKPLEENQRGPYILIAKGMIIGARVFAVLFFLMGLLFLVAYFRLPEDKMLHLAGVIGGTVTSMILIGFSKVTKKMRQSITDYGTTMWWTNK